MGKTMLLYKVGSELEITFTYEPRTCVAFAFFRDLPYPWYSLAGALRSCVIQIASHDSKYREEVMGEFYGSSRITDYGDAEAPLIWKQFFATKFRIQDSRRLVLLLDGIDYLDANMSNDLLAILSATKDPSLQIQRVVSSCTGYALTGFEFDQAIRVVLDKPILEKDMRLIAFNRAKQLSRLKKTRTIFRKQLAVELSRAAESRCFVCKVSMRGIEVVC
jgi:hypothetical protein